MTFGPDRTTDLSTFAVLVTTHETSQNYLQFPGIPNDDWPAMKAWLEAHDPTGRWVTDSLYCGEIYFYTVLSGFGPASVVATSRNHWEPDPDAVLPYGVEPLI